ncbi:MULTISPECIES: DUF559 domain-containing protein [Acinetobacter]|nr:DUF559 domain-containing protein [Acinetobacter bereziniae]MBJ8476914.1 DUF559 domain-containing protein [Acinetobacter bereziniae]
MNSYNKKLKLLSRDLRKNMIDAELLLWSKLQDKQISVLQFYSKKPIVNFTVILQI